MKDACEVLDEEIAALEEELKQVKQEIAREQPERETLFAENEQFKKHLSKLNQEQLDLQLVCQNKKSENNEVKHKIVCYLLTSFCLLFLFTVVEHIRCRNRIQQT